MIDFYITISAWAFFVLTITGMAGATMIIFDRIRCYNGRAILLRATPDAGLTGAASAASVPQDI